MLVSNCFHDGKLFLIVLTTISTFYHTNQLLTINHIDPMFHITNTFFERINGLNIYFYFISANIYKKILIYSDTFYVSIIFAAIEIDISGSLKTNI